MTHKKNIRVILMALMLVVGFLGPMSTHAQVSDPCNSSKKIRVQVKIPGVGFSCIEKDVPVAKDGKIVLEDKELYYVSNLQQYIAGIYNFFIGGIAVAAVVVLMVGGAQYILAAGNQSKLGEAKKTMAGAITGLVITLLSYTILNSINPRITSLEVHSVDPVRAVFQAGVKCHELPVGYRVLDSNKNEVPIQTTTAQDNHPDFWCESPTPFQFKDSTGVLSEDTCVGTFCGGGGQVCIIGPTNTNPGQCKTGAVYGSIRFDSGAYIDNNLELRAICDIGGGAYEDMDVGRGLDLPYSPPSLQYDHQYQLPADLFLVEELRNPCRDTTKHKPIGFYLRAEINDESLGGLGPGCDDWYGIGVRRGASGNICDIPVNPVSMGIGEFVADQDGAAVPKAPQAIKNWAALSDRLIPIDETVASGFECNINITRTEFPARDNAIYSALFIPTGCSN